MRNTARGFFRALLLWIIFAGPVYSRDVNLDAVYFKVGSPILSRLTTAKLDLYSTVNAAIIDDEVAYAGWGSGSTLVYIRDLGTKTEICTCSLETRVQKTIAVLGGAPVTASIASGGRFLCLKTILVSEENIEYHFGVVDIRTGKTKIERSSGLFCDYSITPFGNSYLQKRKRGIEEIFPDTNVVRLIIPEKQIVHQNEDLLCAYFAPNGSRVALLTGGGGSYQTTIYDNGVIKSSFDGAASISEFAWLDSRRAAYRTGYAGNYRLAIRDVSVGTIKYVGNNTFNTNLSWAPQNSTVSFLQDGCISFYMINNDTLEIFPIEGEDVSFASGGNRFAALCGGRLFVVHREFMRSKIVELKRSASAVKNVYKDAAEHKELFENEFSSEYVARKISLYERICK